jgi:hypothetical protein
MPISLSAGFCICLFNHASVVVRIPVAKSGLLDFRCLEVPEYRHHVRPVFTLEVSPRDLAGRQEKHDSVSQKAKADSLLRFEILDVLVEHIRLVLILGHEGNNSLHFVMGYVIVVRAMRNVQIMVVVKQKLVVASLDDKGIYCNFMLPVARKKATPYVFLIVIYNQFGLFLVFLSLDPIMLSFFVALLDFLLRGIFRLLFLFEEIYYFCALLFVRVLLLMLRIFSLRK